MPSHGSRVEKMGGALEELGVGRAKLRVLGQDLGSCKGLGLETLPEEARSRASAGWGLSGPGGAELGGGWQPSEAPDCQRAEFDV